MHLVVDKLGVRLDKNVQYLTFMEFCFSSVSAMEFVYILLGTV